MVQVIPLYPIPTVFYGKIALPFNLLQDAISHTLHNKKEKNIYNIRKSIEKQESLYIPGESIDNTIFHEEQLSDMKQNDQCTFS